MRYDPAKHDRRSVRLKGYDYTRANAYFVTVVCQDRTCLFGRVEGEAVVLNGAGRAVASVWSDLPIRFPSVSLDAFMVMPNHVHGVVERNSLKWTRDQENQTSPDAG